MQHIDLHSHTTCSDGFLTPEELVLRAEVCGVEYLAITDHDNVMAFRQALMAIEEKNLKLTLIPGVEISVCWGSREIHIVGLNLDPEYPELVAELERQIERRDARARLMSERLERCRIPETYTRAKELAKGGAITRAHFARVLIEREIEPDFNSVFKRYLAQGKKGYAPPNWIEMTDAIELIHRAGGQAVMAHPGKYDLSNKWIRKMITEFKQAGGDAMEVAVSQQSPAERDWMAEMSVEYQLQASCGSDFHQAARWCELGRGIRLPENCDPVWRHWPQLQC